MRAVEAPQPDVLAAVDRRDVFSSQPASTVRLSDHGFTILQIETLLACNMACGFCAYPLLSDKGARLTTATILSVLDQVDPDDPGLEYVCLSHYNEPLLDGRIYDLIGEVKSRGMKVLIITNGLAFRSEEAVARLLDAEPDLVKISYQTASASRFYAARGANLSYERYSLGVSTFLREAVRRDSKSSITLDFACNFLTPAKRLRRELLGVECGDRAIRDEIRILTPFVLDVLETIGYEVPQLRADRAEAKRFLDSLERDYQQQSSFQLSDSIGVKVKRFIHGRRLASFRPATTTAPCGTRILSVLANGSVVPCCLVHEDLLSMGNANSETLREMLERGAPMLRAIHAGKGMPKVCRVCQGAPTARGALVVSGVRAYRERPILATAITGAGATLAALLVYAAHPGTPAFVDMVRDAYLVVSEFLAHVLDYHISPRLWRRIAL